MLENYVEILALIATIYGSLMSFSYIFQIHKMWKRKSSADVSIATYLILLGGFIIWVFYGISINAFPIIITNVVATIAGVSVIITYYIYKK